MREIILVAHVFAMPLSRTIERDTRFQRAQAIVRPMLIDEPDESHFFGIEARGLGARTFSTIASAIHARFAHFTREIAANRTTTAAAGRTAAR